MRIFRPDNVLQCAIMIAIPHFISPQDYLALDRQNPIRHEYRQGLVYAMTGGSDAHSRITINLLSLLNLHLDETPCRLYNGDVKVLSTGQKL